ncbi:MAG TPA: hypothetical protein VK157_16335 [Phycisphaerales bacterium]|nr:hypothetical protein [Phycisphaerales bacterium]
MKMVVLLSALAGSASVVFAQGTLPAYPLESEIRLEVWNGTSWGNTVNASPGQQVEYRVVMNYTGPRTDLLGLAGSRYQISFSNADNSGTSKDNLAAFPSNGFSNYTNNLLTAADGANGTALPAYGRVTYGYVGQFFGAQNVLTNFRHGGDSSQAGAPAGSWLRVAGSFVNAWPAQTLSATQATATALNNIVRGVNATQQSQVQPILNTPNTYFAGGVHNIVVFRHALTLSDSDIARSIEISIPEGSLQRAGSANSGDDRRFITWHDQVVGDTGTYRTSVAIVPATIVIPTPGVFTFLALTSLLAAHRRR